MEPNDVSIILPAEAETLIVLTEKIIEQHSVAGPASPLNTGHVADINYKVKCARDKHEEVLKYKKLMEDAMQERDRFLGLRGNNGGVKQTMARLIQVLNELYRGNFNELVQWGLDYTKQENTGNR